MQMKIEEELFNNNILKLEYSKLFKNNKKNKLKNKMKKKD
jgi:hypothetical protein